MKTSDLKVDLPKTIGDELILVDKPRPVFSYENGKRTDTVEAMGYPTVSSKTWDKYLIKVKETVPSVEFTDTPIKVAFTNLEGKVWYDFKSNEIKLSITADSISVVAENRLKVNKGSEIQ